jgi:hypothetical protein
LNYHVIFQRLTIPRDDGTINELVSELCTMALRLLTRWADDETMFDHALICLDLPYSQAVACISGTCREYQRERKSVPLQIDITRLDARCDDFTRVLADGMRELQASGTPWDSFESLTAMKPIAGAVCLGDGPSSDWTIGRDEEARPFMF